MTDQAPLRTLSERFRFPGANRDDLARVLAEEPLVGDRSIFGHRTVSSAMSDGGVRRALGFQPAPVPLLRFDVEMRQHRTHDDIQIIVELTQPGRRRPYLAGQFVWLISDEDDGATAVLREEINTPAALSIVERPLHGHRFSLRRYLFFAGGHQRLMKDVEANIRVLLD